MPTLLDRATHNLWTLLDEARQIKTHLTNGSYRTWYQDHLDNSIYLPLIKQTLSQTIQSSLSSSSNADRSITVLSLIALP